MDYKHISLRLVMSTKTTKMLGVGIAAIAFLLVTVPIFKSGVAYADSGDHGDHDKDMETTTMTMTMNHDHGDHDHGDHDHDHN